MAAHLTLAVVEVRGAGFVLAVLEGFAELTVELGDGTDQTIHDLLRWQVRESRGRGAEPSAIVMDTQTVT
ncbi:hypothetical protein [Streptomyces sp. NPDC001652]|uniref:hypothetical protein n=1 Tax=Streptomyces sp. NPDC001652 TaxID=3154393 RepID=UPI00331F068F